jgi:HAD superfamily hydrolase (TIGR01509 family)
MNRMGMSHQPAAVLWDMDGTLVDTEPYWIAAEYELVHEFGGEWSDAHAHTIVGSALLTGAAYIREHGSVPLEPAEIVDRLVTRVIEQVAVALPWQPGARELLIHLAEAGIPSALVTMSYRSLAMAVVDQLPAGTFSAIVTGDSVTHGKPHPEPYLVASAELGLRPEDCIALEDSPTGVASAEAAGCVTLAIPHIAPVQPGPGRTVIETLEGLDVAALAAFVAASR